MLQSIRDHTQGWVAGVIISVLILSFALWGIHSYFVGGGDNNVVAKVNKVEITKNQLAVAYERLRRQLQMQSGNQLSSAVEANLKQQALQTLINIEVLKQAALAENYRVAPNQVDGFLQSMPEFQVNGEFSVARFQQALAATLFTANDFFNLIQTSLLIDQPRVGITLTSFALPNETNDTIALIGQERKIQYLLVPQEYLATQPITISDEQVKAYYNEHQDDYKTPEQVSIDYVTLSLKDLAAKIIPTDDQLKSFYSENSTTFVVPAEVRLDEIILPIPQNATEKDIKDARSKMDTVAKAAKSGKDFANLAKEYSLSLGDKQLNNWTSTNALPAELQNIVSALTKPGQVSEVIATSRGLILLKLVDYKQQQAQAFDKVKAKVKEMYQRQKAEEQFGDVREKLANMTYEHPDTLAGAAKELGLQVNTTSLFTKDKGGNDITSNAKIREAAFYNDVLNLQNNSDVIQVDPESVVVIRVNKHNPATQLSLSAVEKQITDKLKVKEMDNNLSKFVHSIQQKLQTGELTAQQVSAQNHLQWVDAGFIGRHSTKIDQAILDSAFEMPYVQNKITYSVTKTAKGFAIVALDSVKNATTSVSKEQYQVFAEQIQNSAGMLEYNLYKDRLIKESKIQLEN